MSVQPPRPSKLRIWLAASRPATLTASLAPVAVGTGLAAAAGSLRWSMALAALAGAVGIQVGTNLVNDWSDFRRGADTDERLGPPRAVQQGWLNERQVLAGAVVAFVVASLAGAALVASAGWPILVLGLVSVAAGVAYTCGPWPLAYTGLGEPFVLGFFGLAAVAGTYYVQVGELAPEAFLAGASLGLLACGILVVNNLRDRVGDEQANKRTLVVRLGPRFARWEYTACLVLAFALAPLGYALSGRAGWLAPLLCLPLAALELRGVWTRDGAALNRHLGGTGRLELAFALALTIGVWPWS